MTTVPEIKIKINKTLTGRITNFKLRPHQFLKPRYLITDRPDADFVTSILHMKDKPKKPTRKRKCSSRKAHVQWKKRQKTRKAKVPWKPGILTFKTIKSRVTADQIELRVLADFYRPRRVGGQADWETFKNALSK